MSGSTSDRSLSGHPERYEVLDDRKSQPADPLFADSIFMLLRTAIALAFERLCCATGLPRMARRVVFASLFLAKLSRLWATCALTIVRALAITPHRFPARFSRAKSVAQWIRIVGMVAVGMAFAVGVKADCVLRVSFATPAADDGKLGLVGAACSGVWFNALPPLPATRAHFSFFCPGHADISLNAELSR